MNLNQLTPDELAELHSTVVDMREKVLELVQKYEFSANQLVSRTMEHEIESVYGKKLLKQLKKIEENTENENEVKKD